MRSNRAYMSLRPEKLQMLRVHDDLKSGLRYPSSIMYGHGTLVLYNNGKILLPKNKEYRRLEK